MLTLAVETEDFGGHDSRDGAVRADFKDRSAINSQAANESPAAPMAIMRRRIGDGDWLSEGCGSSTVLAEGIG